MRRKNKNFFKRTARNSQSFQGRILAIHFIFIIFFLFLGYRLYNIQIIENSKFVNQAEALHHITTILPPDRGSIYFQDKNKEYIPVAINKKYNSLYAIPKEIEDPEETSRFLSKIIPLSYEQIFSHLNKIDDPYEPLLKKIEDDDLIDNIQNAKIKGIYFEEESYRYYPLGSFAVQVIGFVGEMDDGLIKGRYGLELYYDEVLSGQAGIFQGVRDAFGRLVRSVFSQETQVQEGADIITTLDKNIQFSAEQIIQELIKTRQATQGTLIVMEVKTGRILALANYPTFNLNEFNTITDYSVFRNYAVEDRYEPGSIIKSLTMAAGLDLGLITPTTTYDDKGYFEVGGYKLVNYNNEVYGKNVTMTRVLERSINTGAIFIGQELGIENLRKYFKNFGLDKITGIDLPNEIAGDLSNLEYPKANPTYLSTASYGSGIAITSIELLKAYSAIPNKGLMVTPYLIEGLRDSNNLINPVTIPEPQRVLSEKTAETLSSILVSVVENGFGINTKIKGYSTGGKTGTAYIPLPNGRGYSEDMIHTYIGYFPASDPQFLILVKMDRPQSTSDSASHTVTISFKQMEQFLINYFNIPPDEM